MFTITRCPAIATAIALSSVVAYSASFDPATDFSLSGNPNGPWSYGYSLTLGSPLILHATSGSVSGLDFWNTDISLRDPWVVHNPTAASITWNGTAVFAPGALSLHPGPNGEVAILRFTAPLDGEYLIGGSFFGQDAVGPTTSDVHILLNGAPVFDGTITGFGASQQFNTTLTLAGGSHLDFAVGFGANQTFFYDSTGLSALITPVPEPSTLALIGVAAGFLCLLRRREH